jgi:hypothetical protein
MAIFALAGVADGWAEAALDEAAVRRNVKASPPPIMTARAKSTTLEVNRCLIIRTHNSIAPLD